MKHDFTLCFNNLMKNVGPFTYIYLALESNKDLSFYIYINSRGNGPYCLLIDPPLFVFLNKDLPIE
jgi:hypothetical protein